MSCLRSPPRPHGFLIRFLIRFLSSSRPFWQNPKFTQSAPSRHNGPMFSNSSCVLHPSGAHSQPG